jgi:NTE family protein
MTAAEPAGGPPPGRGIVLACQGGGSHTAFTSGVLRELLRRDLDIRALSGTSGGAVCAYLAWTGLLQGGPAGRELGIARLTEFWEGLKPHGLLETLTANLTVDAVRAAGRFGFMVEVSPYLNPFEPGRELRALIDETVPPPLPAPSPTAVRLLVSAADVNTGEFRIFRSHPDGRVCADEITSTTLLASAAVPTVFRAVHLEQHRYWDGLFAQNPPVRDLPDAARNEGTDGLPPAEVWVITINPFTHRGEPRAVDDIRDRRNELAANISFAQEVQFIGKINELVRLGRLAGPAKAKYAPIRIRAITMADEVGARLDYESKLSRDPALIDLLTEHGLARAREFLSTLTWDAADELTAIPGRDIWGRAVDANWTALPE